MEFRSESRVALVVAAVAAAAGVCVAVAFGVGGGDVAGSQAIAAAFLAPLLVAGRVFPVPLAFRRRMVTDTAPLFAAALLLPPWLTAALVLPAIGGAELLSGRRLGHLDTRQVVFNSSQAVLGALAAATVFHALAPGGLAGQDGRALLAVGAAALAMIAVNDALVFSVVWAQMGLRFGRMVGDFIRGRSDLPYDIALYCAGLVTALIGTVNPWLVFLLGAPLPVLYRAMQARVALREQTRAAVIALADTVDDRDPYTFGHCARVAEFTERICQQLGLSRDQTDEIVLAARVHDVGKIGIRDAVLLKPGRLTAEEFAHIREHPEIGARLTARFPEFAKGTRYIRHHHEKWDGSGYPSGLDGKDIPLGARIIAVADTYDAITSTRVYRDGLTDDFARQEMARVAGRQLDAEVVAAWFVAQEWEWPAQEPIGIPTPVPADVVSAA